eukprot:353412-Chlamydomonas_euryale.AAC.2
MAACRVVAQPPTPTHPHQPAAPRRHWALRLPRPRSVPDLSDSAPPAVSTQMHAAVWSAPPGWPRPLAACMLQLTVCGRAGSSLPLAPQRRLSSASTDWSACAGTTGPAARCGCAALRQTPPCCCAAPRHPPLCGCTAPRQQAAPASAPSPWPQHARVAMREVHPEEQTRPRRVTVSTPVAAGRAWLRLPPAWGCQRRCRASLGSDRWQALPDRLTRRTMPAAHALQARTSRSLSGVGAPASPRQRSGGGSQRRHPPAAGDGRLTWERHWAADTPMLTLTFFQPAAGFPRQHPANRCDTLHMPPSCPAWGSRALQHGQLCGCVGLPWPRRPTTGGKQQTYGNRSAVDAPTLPHQLHVDGCPDQKLADTQRRTSQASPLSWRHRHRHLGVVGQRTRTAAALRTTLLTL